MAWNEEVSRRLHEAFEDNDVVTFSRLLRDHPEHRRDDDGSDIWMMRAAWNGRLEIIKVLVDLGLDVNEAHDHGDPNDPLYEPEGAILHAASHGHVDIVRWLLENGANINYEVQGRLRCLPLIRASTGGYLEIVKLLVQHGAALHATWRGLNAITQAEDFGKWAVWDYLHSLGARTLRETTPPDYQLAHQTVLQQMAELYGPVSDWKLEIAGDPFVVVHLIPPSKRQTQLLFTIGLSDRRLPQGRREFACTELRCVLPPEWPLTPAALQDPKWNWPIDWLKKIVQEIRQLDRWPDNGLTFANGDPAAALASDTTFCAWVCVKVLGQSVQAPDFRWIDSHALVPIYPEELTLLRISGFAELVDRLESLGAPLGVDLDRQNVANDQA